jgi:malic enzyme
MSFARIGEVDIVPPFEHSENICEVGQYFASAYIMGMMVRYYPTHWVALSRTENGDAVYPLMLKLVKQIEYYFPRIALDHLDFPYDFEIEQVKKLIAEDKLDEDKNLKE